MTPTAAPSALRSPRTGLGSPLNDRQVWWISFLLFSALGAVWAMSMPLLVGPDEPAHAGKAAAVVRGELTWVARQDITGTDAANPTRSEITLRVPRAYAELDYACIALPPLQPASCMTAIPRRTDTVEVINSAGAYPPVFYALVGWPSLILPPSKAIYAMRLTNVALCAALVASALVAGRRADLSGTTIVGIAAALTPMAIFLMAVVNPNALEVVAALGTLVAALEVVRADRPTTRSILRFVVAASLLTLARPLSVVVLVTVAALVAIAALDPSRARALLRDRRVRIGALPLGAAAAFAGFWLLYAEPQRALWGRPRPGIPLGEALRGSLSLLPWRVRQMIGVFGWIDAHAPLPVSMIVWWLVVVSVLVAAALIVGSARRKLAVTLSVAAVIGFTLSEATQVERIGFVWQGRYSLPLAVAVPTLAAWVIGTSGRIPERTARMAGSATIASLAAIVLVSYIVVMRRYVVGIPSPSLAYLFEGVWQPKLPKLLLFALATLVTAAIGLWLARLARPDPAVARSAGGQPALVGCRPASSSESLTV
ncbi:MAG: DUF2142 domain-containing protein [Acidimicrobiales bacterium]